MKYTIDEIKRIMGERVEMLTCEAGLKRGVICEWTFTYPTGKKTAEVEYAFPIDEDEFDFEKGEEIILQKIERKVWEICGKYTLATGDKL